MIKLDFLLVCDQAFFSEPDKKLNIIGVFDTVNVPGLPAALPKMSVVAKFYMDRGNYNETMAIRKNGSEIIKISNSIDKKESGKHQIIHNLLNTIFKEAGEHIIEMSIDDNIIASTALDVKVIQ